MPPAWLVLCVLVLLALGSLCAADTVTLPCGTMKLTFDAATGQWCGLSADKAGTNLLGAKAAQDTVVLAEKQPWPEASTWKAGPWPAGIAGDGNSLTLTRESGPWQLTTTFRAVPLLPLLQRSVKLTWHGAEPLRARCMILRVPGITLAAPDAIWCLPGTYPVVRHSTAAAVPGRVTREPGWTWSDTGVGYASSEATGRGLVVAYSMEQDHPDVRAEEVVGGVTLEHWFNALANVPPGGSLEVGTQWIAVTSGGLSGLRKASRDLGTRVNGGPPADRPAWLKGASIVELSPWGRLEAWWAGDRGDRMPSIEAQLPYLHDLGADATWILPVSNKPPWVYYLPTFRNIDPQVTTPEQLKSFIAAGHKLGIRTMMDLVLYGISPDSPDVKPLPDSVWCRTEKGEQDKAWGGTVLAADTCNPDWRAHNVDLCSWWVREFGADGFRLDCGGCGQALNWQPQPGRHLDSPIWAGGIEENAQVREAIRRINPDAVLMPEAGATCHFRSADLLFDYPLYMICREITREPDTAVWVSRLRDWLTQQQFTHSPQQAAAMVRFLELHDAVAAQEYFGAGPSHALTALCALIPGTFLFQQEQEIGFAPELREWLRLRHERPDIREGDADFTAVTSDAPTVFAFLRRSEASASLVAINFGPETAHCRMQWKGQPTSGCRDAITGAGADLSGPVTVAPYGVRVIALGGIVPVARPSAAGGTVALSQPPTTEALPGGDVRTHIHLAPMSRWFVMTGEGLLEDEFVDRHRGVKPGETYVDATPPLARCWRPLEQGLWDTCAAPCLGGLSADGRAVVIAFPDRARLRCVRIEDPSLRGEAAEIVVEATAGQAPFRITEQADGRAYLDGLRQRSCTSKSGPVTVDPLWVHVANAKYTLALSRRHGGTIGDLRPAGAATSWTDRATEIYTDWGLFEKGQHISTDGETDPTLDVADNNGATEVTFRGRMHGASWNGVQTAPVAGPAVAYRITYRFDASSAIGVTFGLTPSTDHPDTKAFYAYRIPFPGVTRWSVAGIAKPLGGATGERPGQRVFQGRELGPDLPRAEMTLQFGAGALRIRGMTGKPEAPQNPILLDDGAGTAALFFALFDGGSVSLKAGEERTASFEMVVP